MNSNFFSLSKITDQHIVQKILDAWFSKRIQLFCILAEMAKNVDCHAVFRLRYI